MFLFYALSFFKKWDTIQEKTLFKGGHYLRKYGIHVYVCINWENGNRMKFDQKPTLCCIQIMNVLMSKSAQKR
jgi:hypothetical protein